MRRLLALLVLAAVAIGVALLSVNLERIGPELGEAGNLCGPNQDEWCYVPVVNGGWPLAYLFDSPSVSVPNQLGFFEDKFKPLPFALDAIFYFALFLTLRALWRCRARR